jgi:methylation protein EvaC
MKCRITKEKCKAFLDFGKMPIANGFLKKKDFKKEYFFNLKVAFNEKLSLFQLVSNPEPKKMFNKNYPFYTSSSKYMIEHFKKYSKWIKKKYLSKHGNLLELGSNDGTFLENFSSNFTVGFEPSKSVHDIARKKGINSINKFFNYQNVRSFIKKKIKFDAIVGSNVICHIPDQIGLIKNFRKILKDNGHIIFEEPYLGSMYQKTSYDQIYDEHIYMFSASSVDKIYKKFGLKLIDAIPQKTHGGSLRYIISCDTSKKISKRLINILNNEKKLSIDKYKGCLNFKKKVEKSKNILLKKIKKYKENGYRICGYGATSKSTTILNYCKINSEFIDCIFDTTPDKIGKYSPGMHIPIKDYKYFKNSKFKKVFLFAWNHKAEILKKEKNSKNVEWFTHLN